MSVAKREDSVVPEYTAEIEKLLVVHLISALCGSKHMEIDEWREERFTAPLCVALNPLIGIFGSHFPRLGVVTVKCTSKKHQDILDLKKAALQVPGVFENKLGCELLRHQYSAQKPSQVLPHTQQRLGQSNSAVRMCD